MPDRGGKQGVWATRDGVERWVATPGGTVNAPAWHPDGVRLAFGALANNESRLLPGSEAIVAGEDVFPFRSQVHRPRRARGPS